MPRRKIEDIEDIVEKYLVDNGYDGLLNFEVGCSCSIDVLMYCRTPLPACAPAYREPCKYVDGVCVKCESSEADKDLTDGFHFTTRKPRRKKSGRNKNTRR